MEREMEWKEEEVVEVGGGLETRQRRRGKMGREIEEALLEKFEDRRSIYLELEVDRGTEVDSNTAGLEEEKVDQLVSENDLGNGKTEFSNHESIIVEEDNQNSKNIDQLVTENNLGNGKEEINYHESISVEEENQNLKYVTVENGSNLHHHCVKTIENEITSSEDEIEEHGKVRLVKSDKLVVAEIDVERVLEEQDTHDLYCPNCNSCITKRVILRKRKRTLPVSHYDAPPEKVRQVQCDQEASSALAESAEQVHQNEPDVFRCLSCFSFFITTETGFNIFRIFGKREETKNLQSSPQIPARNIRWVSSIFKPETNKTKGTGAVSLPGESNVIGGEQMDHQAQIEQSSLATTISGGMKHEENQIITSKSDAGVPIPVEYNVISGGSALLVENQSSPALTVSGATKMRENQTAIGNNDADPLPGGPYTNGGGQMGDQEPKDMQNYPAKTITGGMNLGESQTTTGKSDAGDGIIKPAAQAKPTFPKGTSEIDLNINSSTPPTAAVLPFGDEIIKPAGMAEPSFIAATTQSNQNIQGSVPPATVVVSQIETHIFVGGPSVSEAGRNNDWDVLKSIVYGGLIESITSLGVVSSAAGAETSTLNIFAMGLANLIGGLFVIAHDLSELRSTQDPEAANQKDKPGSRYRELLGRRSNFRLHATVAILSYIIFGLLPPIVYGFSFRKSDNKEFKLIAVAAASLPCIALLAIGKAHVRPQKGYIQALSYYIGLGVAVSGLSYVAGVMINRLLSELGLFDQGAAVPSPPSAIGFLGSGSAIPGWASETL